MEKMREQLTADKASQYTKKVTDKVRRRATELVGAYSALLYAYTYFRYCDYNTNTVEC